MEDVDKIAGLQATDASTNRSFYVNILRNASDEKVFSKFIETGGWKIIYKWLEDAKTEDNIPFMIELLRVYQQLPVTIDLLKQNNCAKTIKQLGKLDNEVVKSLSSEIVSKWVQKVRDTSDSSSGKTKKKSNSGINNNKKSEAKSSVHHHHQHHHNQDSNKHRNNSDSDDLKDASYTKDNHLLSNNTQSADSDVSCKPKPKTVKTAPTKFRSTGLEPNAQSKGKTEKAPIKRPSVNAVNKNQQPPEKKPRNSSGKANAIAATSPTETHGKIKLIPPRPKVEVFESSGFMDALTNPVVNNTVRRKRRGSVGQKTATPTSPPSNKQVPTFYKDTLDNTIGEPDAKKQATNTNLDNGQEIKPTENEDTASVSTRDDSETRSVSPVSITNLVNTSGKPMKKSVRWASEENLQEFFYFELDETERVNVNRQKDDLLKEGRYLQSARKLGNDSMAEGTNWRRPAIIIGLPISQVTIGCNSLEKDIQKQRVEGQLETLYFTPSKIPDTAEEPDIESHDFVETKEIPLNDTTGGESTYEYTSMVPPLHRAQVPGIQPPHGQVSLPSDVAGILHNMAAQVQQQHYPQDGINANIQNLMNNVINETDKYNGELTNRLHNILEPYQEVEDHHRGWAQGMNDHPRGPRPLMNPDGVPSMRGGVRAGVPRGGIHGHPRGPLVRGGPPLVRGRGVSMRPRGRGAPTVCTNFIGGFCHFEARCRFLHPGVNAPPL